MKFAIHPGYVTENKPRPDNWDLLDPSEKMEFIRSLQRHYIGFGQLVRLYGVNPNNCIKWDDEDPRTYLGRDPKNYNHLYPNRAGNYKL